MMCSSLSHSLHLREEVRELHVGGGGGGGGGGGVGKGEWWGE